MGEKQKNYKITKNITGELKPLWKKVMKIDSDDPEKQISKVEKGTIPLLGCKEKKRIKR